MWSWVLKCVEEAGGIGANTDSLRDEMGPVRGSPDGS